MMRLFRKKDGFTLVELLIVILTGTIVTAATTTILLLAMRINRKTLDTVERQSIMRIMQSVFEDLGSEGNYEFTTDAIKVKGSETDYVLSYDDTNDQLVTGQGGVLMEDVTSFQLEKTTTPFAYVRGLYTFSIESKGETYVSSVYGRTQDDAWFADDPALDYESGRNQLVDIAASQIGSTGKIIEWYIDEHININGVNRVEFNRAATDKESWNPSTPWCATFVSWALNQCEYVDIDTVDEVHYLYGLPQDASVNYLWMENFVLTDKTDQSHMKVNDATTGTYHTPLPGDLIFFEYYDPYPENPNDEDYEPEDNPEAPLAERQNLNGLKFLENSQRNTLNLAMDQERKGYYININPDSPKYTKTITPLEYNSPLTNKADYVEYDVMKHYLGCVGDGLDHVGIVVKVEYEEVDGEQVPYVYTIEGNVITNESAGMAKHSVMLRKYTLDDEDIFGYATLNWNEAYK